MINPYQEENRLEAGIDEAGRGCLFGRVYVACVILPPEIQELCQEYKIVIKDSKKMSKKEHIRVCAFIEEVAIDYAVVYKEPWEIDSLNILRATVQSMHECVDQLKIRPEKLLVDGNYFPFYKDKEGQWIEHECIVKGDNTYMSIAAASILAKRYKDKSIVDLVESYPELEKYDLLNHFGYGTASHIESIRKYGITQYHRKSFGICKDYDIL